MHKNLTKTTAAAARHRIKRVAFCAAALLALCGCGGGFGADSGNASEIGPGIFEPDSARQRQ